MCVGSLWYPVRFFVSVRDMFEDESDLYNINSDKAISMDFDWKRRPLMGSLERGIKGMRGALSNYRTDDVDPPNQTPSSAEMEKIVEELLELFPSFEADSVFVKYSS